MSDTNRVGLKYVPEATIGITPVNSANWKTIRYTGESLLPNYGTKQSEQIRDDRERSDVVQTSATISGGINYELSGITLDDFLEAVLGGTWTADVLKTGVVKRSFSIEKSFGDLLAGNKFDVFKGMRIGELNLELAYDEIAKGSMTFAGTGVADSATSAVGAGSVAAATTTSPFNGTVDVIAVEIDGVASSLYFNKLSLALNANLRGKTAIGGKFPFDQGYGSAGVQLSATAYFDNRSIEDKVRSGAPFSMGFNISDGTYGYEILLPRAFSSQRGGLAATGLNADVFQELTISGAIDATAGSSIVITRTNP